ncbi:uncharacterized protein LOC108992759 isoform X2 [Juglans regia]|uniref:Uncharacterized protein LOC108992759 isoform X2 n=1 Tax=Juglans regia TaxID=51240 RepID=A0A6P9EM81_JUGRE|nr:uncharacterized protein LOC108992759 isoform X2 [Juglans regia]XP_035548557.1 uncharacterized protein LOC108992759 isoform X2 [Juglans regia]
MPSSVSLPRPVFSSSLALRTISPLNLPLRSRFAGTDLSRSIGIRNGPRCGMHVGLWWLAVLPLLRSLARSAQVCAFCWRTSLLTIQPCLLFADKKKKVASSIIFYLANAMNNCCPSLLSASEVRAMRKSLRREACD